MRAKIIATANFLALALLFPLAGLRNKSALHETARQQPTFAEAAMQPQTYLGFDRNNYPGDAALATLRKTFAFSGYWLNAPPGENTTAWTGKREILRSHRFGFLVLFNGRLDKELQRAPNATQIGANDAATAVKAAQLEGFPRSTIIFLDQEEGGRMLPKQRAYLYAWIDAVNATGYRAGVYCSGMPDVTDAGVITANDIRENAAARKIAFFIYNDACPPSPGCIFSTTNATPARSSLPFASVWQISQSPRRKNFTSRCSRTYAADGNCYPPGLAAQKIYVDVDVATSPDPSTGH
ncbi:MAG TPA: glycoside hydrolase domain-containing protein [Candidatus Acidoferrales bacterium]|nr:glycoside hydrolase domain-containing protein [Candidatus Acidoferrales bacterium]